MLGKLAGKLLGNMLGDFGFFSTAPDTLTPAGPLTPKIIQIENMLAASDTFRAAIGAGTTPTQAKDRIHYDYALMGEAGSDPSENLAKLAEHLPFAVILSHQQFGYSGVAFAGKHYMRSEGEMGLLLIFKDEVEGQDIAACKERQIRMSNFHGQVMDEIADLAGQDGYAPIDSMTMDFAPERTDPLADGSSDETTEDSDRAEVVPYYLVGYAIHWK